MTINSAIDVASALMLTYLVLSLIATALNETIATGADLRSANLETAIGALIDHPQLLTDFYNNGLIASVNTAVTGGKSPLVRGLSGIARWVTRAGPASARPHVSYLSGQRFAQAIIASIDTAKNLPSFDDVKDAVEKLPDTNIRDALLAQIAAAHGDLNALRNGIASWFDDAMERVSGVYKRHLKQISFCVGVALVLVTNADSIKLAKSLWNDSALRAGMVEAAAKMVQSGAPPAGGNGANVGLPSGTNQGSDTIRAALTKLSDYQSTLRPLPLGWHLSGLPEWSWNVAAAAPVKIVGLLLTAIAISLGAPFWFDLLSMFMRIRGTGDKPEVDPQTGTT